MNNKYLRITIIVNIEITIYFNKLDIDYILYFQNNCTFMSECQNN